MSQQTKIVQKSLILGGFVVAVIAFVMPKLASDDTALLQSASGQSAQNQLVEKEGRMLPTKLITDEQAKLESLTYKSRLRALPESLKGTFMDQSLHADAQGDLRISSDIKRVFDYFLSTIEEEELDVILARIDEYLNHYLDEPALSQSKQVLAQYIELKQALYDFELSRSESLKAMMESGELMADKDRYLQLLREQLIAQSDLRSQHLDAEVYEAFYASEEAYDQYSLARLLVEADEDLSSDEKVSRLAQIDAQAPSEIIESRKEAQITDDLKARIAQVEQAGGGYEEIRAVRVDMFGTEAADRFDALDQERAQWKARLDSFLNQRQKIMSMEGLSVEERQAQVDNLRASQFDSREQIRVKVYERKAEA